MGNGFYHNVRLCCAHKEIPRVQFNGSCLVLVWKLRNKRRECSGGNSDNAVSIFATDVDPAAKEGSLAAMSRSYVIAAKQLFDYKIPLLPTGSYNAELVKPLSPEMQAKIQGYGTPSYKF